MQFHLTTAHPGSITADLLIVPLLEGEKKLGFKTKKLNAAIDNLIADVITRGDFTGKRGETFGVYTHDKTAALRLLLLGLGKKKDYTRASLSTAIAAVIPQVKKKIFNTVAFLLPPLPAAATPQTVAHILTESLLLASYRFTEYKKTPDEQEQDHRPEHVHIILPGPAQRAAVQRGVDRGQTIGAAVNYTRDLANHPGNVMTPQKLAEAAIALAKTHRLKCAVLEKADLQKLGMGALLAVNQGSALPPKFIILEYHGGGGTSGQPVVLAGKGITFDSGGISIKPSKNMEEMNYPAASGGVSPLLQRWLLKQS